jgi:hypothetical protein
MNTRKRRKYINIREGKINFEYTLPEWMRFLVVRIKTGDIDPTIMKAYPNRRLGAEKNKKMTPMKDVKRIMNKRKFSFTMFCNWWPIIINGKRMEETNKYLKMRLFWCHHSGSHSKKLIWAASSHREPGLLAQPIIDILSLIKFELGTFQSTWNKLIVEEG